MFFFEEEYYKSRQEQCKITFCNKVASTYAHLKQRAKETLHRLSLNMHMTNLTHQTLLENTIVPISWHTNSNRFHAHQQPMWWNVEQQLATSWHTKCNRDVTITEQTSNLSPHSRIRTRILVDGLWILWVSRRSGDQGVHVHSGSGKPPSKQKKNHIS